jgi:formylglycine-generating enzyme required for sulfatase activity
MDPQSTDIRNLTIEQMAGPSRHLITAGTAGQRTFASDFIGGSVFTRALLDGLRGAADTTSAFESDGLVSVYELLDYIKKRVEFERQKHNWKDPIKPQPRDLAVNEGEFFFISGKHKVKHFTSRGLRITDEFEYGEPVPMTGGAPIASIPFSSSQIRQAQERLSQLGFNPGRADGNMGPNTSAAIRQFQASKRLPTTGDLDRRTWDALAKADIPPPQPPSQAITNSIGMTFVYIAPGTFTMGSPDDELGRYQDETQHQVTLTKGFYMQTTEVTQGQWQAVMGSNPSRFKKCGDNCPVEKVSWYDAQDFIVKLNAKENTGKYRLPTEAEWEYAARAGTQTPFSFGRCLSTDQANYDGNYPLEGCPKGNYRETTVRVGSLQPNAWGLFDMHGNVWEWCRDWNGKKYYRSSPMDNPEGPETGSARVVRGGGWRRSAWSCRSAFRGGSVPDARHDDLGFRLVLFPGQQG